MFQRALDLFRGKAITIPPMDGALRPNVALDSAPSLLDIAWPDNLAWIDGRLVFSTANKVLALDAAGSVSSADLIKFGTHVKKKVHDLYGAHFKALPTGGAGAAPAAPTRMKFDE